MAETTFYGSTVSPTSTSSFRCVIKVQVTEEDATKGNYVQKKFYVQCIKSSSGITSAMQTSWGKSGTVGTAGSYLSSGWKDVGWIAYGDTLSLSANCYYVGGSGKTYKSTGSGTYTSVRTLPTDYTVTYNGNGGTNVPDSQTGTVGESITLSTQIPTRTGYTFKGWSTTSTGAAVYEAGDTYTGDSCTLYAVWEANTYAVTYSANGGSGQPDNQTKTYGQSLTLSSTVPVRTNYTFLGWSTTSTGSVEYDPGATYTKNAALNLYAVWKLNANAYGKEGTWKVGNTYGKADTWGKGTKVMAKKNGTWVNAGV